MYPFEKLAVWSETRHIAGTIYQLTSNFPKNEEFGLTSQLRRAAISVCSNIAEGSTRTSPKDQNRFYNIAYGSLIEVYTQIILSVDLGFIDEEELPRLKERVAQATAKLSKLRAYNYGRIEDKKPN